MQLGTFENPHVVKNLEELDFTDPTLVGRYDFITSDYYFRFGTKENLSFYILKNPTREIIEKLIKQL
jgi:hypothetical protein